MFSVIHRINISPILSTVILVWLSFQYNAIQSQGTNYILKMIMDMNKLLYDLLLAYSLGLHYIL